MSDSAQNILNKNAWWWRTTPNQVYYNEDNNTNFPTNDLTAYTLDEIGDSKNIVLLNQYVISVEGQPSTIEGEDTSINKKDIENYVFQREYLTLIMPKNMGKKFFYNFKPKRECIKIIEEYDFVDNEIKSNIMTNDFVKDFMDINTTGDERTHMVWITATQNKFEQINYTAIHGLNGDYYKDLIYKDGRHLFFNECNKSPIENFVSITLIRPEIGLNDDPKLIEKFKKEGRYGGVINKYITSSTTNDISLIEETIIYFQNEIYLCLNTPINKMKTCSKSFLDSGTKKDEGKKQKSKRRKSKQKSKRRKFI